MLTRPTFTVLVLDTDPAHSAKVETVLKSGGYGVAGPVPDAERALPLFEEMKIHAAFLDVTESDRASAFTIARVLRMRAVPFFFTTGDDRLFPRRNAFKEITLLKPLEGATIEKLLNLVTSTPSYGA